MDHFKKSLKGLEKAYIEVPTVGKATVAGIQVDYGKESQISISQAQTKALPEMQKQLAKIQITAKEISRPEPMARALLEKSRGV